MAYNNARSTVVLYTEWKSTYNEIQIMYNIKTALSGHKTVSVSSKFKADPNTTIKTKQNEQI